MIVGVFAMLASGDICTSLEMRQPIAEVTLVGTVGTELRHAWTWIGNFGCGDRNLILSIPNAAVRETDGGQEFLEALDGIQRGMIAQNDLGPRYDVGMRIRVSGAVIWDDGNPISMLTVSEIDVLEVDQ